MIEPKLNHQLINETLPDMNTTAENIAMWIWANLNNIFRVNIVYALQLFETTAMGKSKSFHYEALNHY